MAAPTSTNEVTARRLTRLLTGSDGNGGLWGKIKSMFVRKSGDTMTGRLTLGQPLSQVITGTGTAGTSSGSPTTYYPAKWNFDLGIPNPVAGDRIVIKLPCAGHDNGCFISTDNGTTYYPVARHTGASRLTTHYNSGSYIMVVFEAYVDANSGQVNDIFPVAGATARTSLKIGCWRVINDYDSGNTVCYIRNENGRFYAGSTGCNPYSLVCLDKDGKFSMLISSGSGTGTSKTINTAGKFKLDAVILYYNANNTTAANTLVASTYNTYPIFHALDTRYSHNHTTTFTANSPLYIECTVDSDGYWSPTTKCITQVLEAGKYYIYLGQTYSTEYQLSLSNFHPIYYYDGTNLTERPRLNSDDRTKLDGISAGANKVTSSTNGKIKIDGTDTTVYTHPSYTAQSAKGSATKVPQITTDATGHVTGITEVTITGVTPASHTHGNIQNGGTLQTSDVTIANGDKLVITDSSDSSKIARASVSFDGSTTTKALTQKGTFESFAKSGDITTAIQALDVSSVGGAGKYISAISETDGKISATATTMDTTPTASSTNAVTSDGIKTALDSKVDFVTGPNLYQDTHIVGLCKTCDGVNAGTTENIFGTISFSRTGGYGDNSYICRFKFAQGSSSTLSVSWSMDTNKEYEGSSIDAVLGFKAVKFKYNGVEWAGIAYKSVGSTTPLLEYCAFRTTPFFVLYNDSSVSNIVFLDNTNSIRQCVISSAYKSSKINTSAKIGDTNKPVYVAADGTVTPISYTIATSVPSGAVFTDTKVTAVGNHYTPSGGTSKDASGGTATQLPTSSTGTLTQVVTGVTVDAAGHVTGVSSKGLWSPNSTYNFGGGTFYSGHQSTGEHNANNIAQNGVYYCTSNGPTSVNGWTEGVVDGAIYSQVHSSNWRAQIAQDYRNGNLAVRGMASGTWTPWNRIVDQKSFASGTGVNLISAFRTGTCSRFTVTNPTNLNAGASFTHDLSTGDSYIRMIVLESIADGETVTLSFDVENLNVSNNEYISFFMQALTGSSKYYKVTANGRQVFVITKDTTTEIPANSILLGFDDGPSHYSVVAPSGFTIKNIKLERGSIATPYSRHPSEDQTKVYYVEGPNTFTAYSSSSTYTKWASGDAYTSSNSCQYNGVAYYCSTAITTAEAWTSSHWTQVPTVDWTGTIPGLTALYTGLKIAYKIPSARGGSTSTRLNINGLGVKTVYRNTGNTTSHLPAGTIVNLTFDGTYWKWADYADGNDWVTSMGAYCTTASSTQAKAATSYGTVYTAGETFLIRFSNSNTYDGKITLNINSQGAKDVWINGAVSSSSNKTLPAGEHWCHYDGSKFLIWTDGTAQFTKLKASATDFPVMTDQEVTDLLGAMTA